MEDLNVTVARVERISPIEGGEDIRLIFQIEYHQTSFNLPIFMNSSEFDDTEIVKVARSKLHALFSQLLSQCDHWGLTDAECQELAKINRRDP
jgi:hypothetical protein